MEPLLFSNNAEGRKDFALLVAALQVHGARFTTGQDREWLTLTILSGEAC